MKSNEPAHFEQFNVGRRPGKWESIREFSGPLDRHQYRCSKCKKGTVKVRIKETPNLSEINVGKCDDCGHQHGIKSLATYERLSY